jgi:regulation of enolase protein 1 (concanavalin A-like superfamily)
VAGNGVIRTVANGVATITATATYRGVSASTEFVVRVLSRLDGLEINGRAVRGFDPDVFDYDVILPPGVTDVPQVTATAPTATLTVAQASAVPGVATVTSTGPDGIASTYHVNFAVAASSDEFDGDALDPKWTVIRPNEANLAIGGGSLTITPEPGQLTTTTNTARNVVLQPALGDWTITTKVVLSQRPNAATQQAGLIAYGDDDNYLKFNLEATSPTNVQLSTSLEDNLRDGLQTLQTLNTTSANDVYPANNTIWLQMAKTEFTYSTSYSLDGETWVPVWTTGATLHNIKVGVLAYTGTAAAGALTAGFDFVHLTTPLEQQLEALSDFVGLLNIDNGLTTDLQERLTEALKKLDRPKDACQQLDLFAAKVTKEATKTQPKLTAEQAEQLLYVNEIRQQLVC